MRIQALRSGIVLTAVLAALVAGLALERASAGPPPPPRFQELLLRNACGAEITNLHLRFYVTDESTFYAQYLGDPIEVELPRLANLDVARVRLPIVYGVSKIVVTAQAPGSDPGEVAIVAPRVGTNSYGYPPNAWRGLCRDGPSPNDEVYVPTLEFVVMGNAIVARLRAKHRWGVLWPAQPLVYETTLRP
jgi:hypothetical protein